MRFAGAHKRRAERATRTIEDILHFFSSLPFVHMGCIFIYIYIAQDVWAKYINVYMRGKGAKGNFFWNAKFKETTGE